MVILPVAAKQNMGIVRAESRLIIIARMIGDIERFGIVKTRVDTAAEIQGVDFITLAMHQKWRTYTYEIKRFQR